MGKKIKFSKYDLVFTSPPYFNTEKYSDSPNQSYKRYPKYKEWKDKFLRVLVKESARVVGQDGFVVINVKNYRNMPIANDTLGFAQENELELVKTYQMRMPNHVYGLKKGQQSWHSEPIFVFSK